MCNEIFQNTTGIIGILIGAVLGFFLSELGTKRREEREDNKLAKSVRMVISLEIDRNLKGLKEFWPLITQPEGSGESEETESKNKSKYAYKFATIPFPDFNRKALDSQLPSLPLALVEQEVVEVFQFYDRLLKLEEIRAQFQKKQQEHYHQFFEETEPSVGGYRSAPVGYKPPQIFNQMANEYWNECEGLVAQLFAKGNPLK